MGIAHVTTAATTLAASYAHSRAIARARAKNFYYSFVLLDRARRDALCSIYAFMRHCDDLSDEPGATAAALEAWRQEMVDALSHHYSANPLWPGFTATIERYRIPHQYLHDMIDGVSSDLTRHRVTTFEELYRYCYRVASVAGLSLVHIFGFRDPRALELAEKCGIAFQLTNILRDVGEDYRLGRVYLPGLDEQAVTAGTVTPGLRTFLADYAGRARGYFNESRPLLEMVEPTCRSSLWALIEIYSRLLDRIVAKQYEVLGPRIRLSTREKAGIVARALLQRGERG